jgi:plasmid stabilization system protein ParE
VSLWADKSEAFLRDYDQQTEWYLAEAGIDVAERFRAAVEETIERLIENPTIGRPRHFRHPALQRLHSFQVNTPFGRFLIFYRIQSSHIEIARLMEGSRDLPQRLVE